MDSFSSMPDLPASDEDDTDDEDEWFSSMRASLSVTSHPQESTARESEAWALLERSQRVMEEQCDAIQTLLIDADEKSSTEPALPVETLLAPLRKLNADSSAPSFTCTTTSTGSTAAREEVAATMEAVLSSVLNVWAIRAKALSETASAEGIFQAGQQEDEKKNTQNAATPHSIDDQPVVPPFESWTDANPGNAWDVLPETVAEAMQQGIHIVDEGAGILGSSTGGEVILQQAVPVEVQRSGDEMHTLETPCAKATRRTEGKAHSRKTTESRLEVAVSLSDAVADLEAELALEEKRLEDEEAARKAAAGERRRTRDAARKAFDERRAAVRLCRAWRRHKLRQYVKKRATAARRIQRQWRGAQFLRAMAALKRLKDQSAEVSRCIPEKRDQLMDCFLKIHRQTLAFSSVAYVSQEADRLRRETSLDKTELDLLDTAERAIENCRVDTEAEHSGDGSDLDLVTRLVSELDDASSSFLELESAIEDLREIGRTSSARARTIVEGKEALRRERKLAKQIKESSQDLAEELLTQPTKPALVNRMDEMVDLAAQLKHLDRNLSLHKALAKEACLMRNRVQRLDSVLAKLKQAHAAEDKVLAFRELDKLVEAAFEAGIPREDALLREATLTTRCGRLAVMDPFRQSRAAKLIQRGWRTACEMRLQRRAKQRIAACVIQRAFRLHRSRRRLRKMMTERKTMQRTVRDKEARERVQKALYDGAVAKAPSKPSGGNRRETRRDVEPGTKVQGLVEAFLCWTKASVTRRIYDSMIQGQRSVHKEAPENILTGALQKATHGHKLAESDLAPLGQWWQQRRIELSVESLSDVSCLARAHQLRHLNLSVNALGADSISAILPSLSALEYLSLRDNVIGEAADESLVSLGYALRGLRHLTHLDLSMNRLKGALGWLFLSDKRGASFPSLDELSLDNNRLTLQNSGAGDRFRVTACALQSLSLFNNRVGPHFHPDSLLDAPLLSRLELSKNLVESIDGVAISRYAPFLMVLGLSNNKLSKFPDGLQLPYLEQLWLSANQISGLTERDTVTFLPSLRKLVLRDNSVSVIPEHCLRSPMDLRELDLSFNCIAAEGELQRLSKLQGLRSLDLRDNPVDSSPTRRKVLSIIPAIEIYDQEEVGLADYAERIKGIGRVAQACSFPSEFRPCHGSSVAQSVHKGMLLRTSGSISSGGVKLALRSSSSRRQGKVSLLESARPIAACPVCSNDNFASSLECQRCGSEIPRRCLPLESDSWDGLMALGMDQSSTADLTGMLCSSLFDDITSLQRALAMRRRRMRQYNADLGSAHTAQRCRDRTTKPPPCSTDVLRALMKSFTAITRTLDASNQWYAHLNRQLQICESIQGKRVLAEAPSLERFRLPAILLSSTSCTKRQSAIRIQRLFRGHRERKRLQTKAARCIQSRFRGWRVRERLRGSRFLDAEVEDILHENTASELNALIRSFEELKRVEEHKSDSYLGDSQRRGRAPSNQEEQ
eukprot:scaffold620_cov282-Pinguiococcus_pyrenoidosus.AAC.17